MALIDEGAAPALPTGAGGALVGTARLVLVSPDEVRLVVDAARPALAILADRFDPDWSVEVDGAAGALLRADGVFRAVEVPAGHHTVRFRYRIPGALGWPITAATLGIVLCAALVLGLAAAFAAARKPTAQTRLPERAL